MLNRLVLATANPGKAAEFGRLLEGSVEQLVPMCELGIGAVQETGLTFVENAILKARAAAAGSGLPALADDSGLEVDALRGAPGVRSARYAGADAGDNDNIDRLLETLAHVPEDRRSARFRCVLVAMRHAQDPAPLICEDTWEGRILTSRSGQGGFGYDPIFFALDAGCSAANLSRERKNALSHRGKAMTKLRAALATWR